jgi:hypothetical protein
MKISCDVIRDLMPAYVDGTLSNDSKILVDEHAAFCAECRAYLEDIRIPESEQAKDRKEQAGSLRKIKNKLMRRNVMIIIITIICLAVCITGFCAYDIFHPAYMASNQVGLEVKNVSGQDALYSNKPYGCANYYHKGKILFVYCTNTVTNRWISGISDRGSNVMMCGLNDEYDAVYYIPRSVAEKLMKINKEPETYGGYFNSLSAGQLTDISELVWRE